MNWRKVLFWLAGFKVVYLLLVIAGVSLAPRLDVEKFYAVSARWPREGGPTRMTHFATWDGAHYLYLSEVGYRQGVPSCAFYPLWPMAMRGLSPLFGGSHLVAGMALGNLCSLAAWVLFWQLVARRFSASVATLSLAFLVLFPGSLFYQFLYSESLFLLLVMLLWWGLERGPTRLAVFAAMVLPLARPMGVLALLPIAWAVFGAKLERAWLLPRLRRLWPRLNPSTKLAAVERPSDISPMEGRYGLLAAPFVGWGVYLALMWHWTGNPFEGFQAQRFWGVHSIWNLVNIPKFVKGFFTPTEWHDFIGSVVDRSAFVLLLYALPVVWRCGRDMMVWTYILGILPAMSGTFVSYTRYECAAFPVFIALGVFFATTERRWLRYVLLGGFAIGQIILAWRFVNFRWAG